MLLAVKSTQPQHLHLMDLLDVWLLLFGPICLNGIMPTHQLVGPFHYNIDVYHL